jgi:hypothetical protein
MTFEKYIARLNGLAFWAEFTFAQNKFMPRPGQEVELTDNLIWLGKYAFVLQLKQRGDETEDPEVERSWFQNKVLNKATRQVRDTMRFLGEHKQIRITNERGHAFEIRSAELTQITKVVVFLGARALPRDCWQTRYHISRTAGFIHILAAHDYLGILEKLRVPEDIRRYFLYREEVTPKLCDIAVEESDIMGAFLGKQDLPTVTSRETLRRFVQDLEAFDLSRLISNLHDHIGRSKQPHDYYHIMLEFARVPRSVWRAIKVRFIMSLEAVKRKEFAPPFRLAFPASDCAFMIAPLDLQIPASGAASDKARLTGVRNLTYLAMYEAKVSKGVGILISKDGEFIQIDWHMLNIPWEPDPEIDAKLAKNNPFREVKEEMVDSFLFVDY